MAFQKIENLKFSGVKGFWKPKEGAKETLIGVALKIFRTSKLMDGKPMTPFFVFEVMMDDKEAAKLTVMEDKKTAIKVKKGDLIGVNRVSQLEGIDLHPGCLVKITFKDYIPLAGGKKVKDFDAEFDPEKVRDMSTIPWAGSGGPTDGQPEEETDETAL